LTILTTIQDLDFLCILISLNLFPEIVIKCVSDKSQTAVYCKTKNKR